MSVASKRARYRRHIDGADFSMESNTDSTPGDGRYYVLQGGEVVLQSHNFRKAEAAYHVLCREFWLQSLASGSPAARLSGAWGLLGLEPDHSDAAAVIPRDGSETDRLKLGRVIQSAPAAEARPKR